VLPIAIWIVVKHVFDISDRFLPGPASLLNAIKDLGWDLLQHTAATTVRALLGYLIGTAGGIFFALVAFRLNILSVLMPTINSVRAVPAIAAVPFFLLWFGFSETGRYLLVAMGLGLNVAVACAEVFDRPRQLDLVTFMNFGLPKQSLVFSYWLPRVIETLLPTLRFGIALALSLIVVSEMLGAQYGLGYLMQTSRATFSLNVLLLCAFLLGIIAIVGDRVVIAAWAGIVTWRHV
jgi:ABC-type nitrate/sulfonate/bicarbonate transport system permease component